MAPFDIVVPPRDSLTFPLVRQNPPDPELTCLVCRHTNPCEWAIELVAMGQRQYIGIHEECIAALEKRKKR